ncbi:Uncharacterised protein [Vibrio cholerae]|uniref:Uncharacterized protein n=1 Tax=Vibrio cholerae TaxID=666 RepID=A0A656A940_VIBCL|nr:Uncharacterised protein [Vibrio cholerae]CRZ93168.1 Uncharacterised protein [Vibrio cholerae]CSA22963.1 Uncharacterised protein [Vibrio cholerae]CSA25767.1 Uncharacterised protein [Vibrio cholerae]CSA49878.1 Uncharacterised protein [Vibrio cholerae]
MRVSTIGLKLFKAHFTHHSMTAAGIGAHMLTHSPRPSLMRITDRERVLGGIE